jgi:hypothetical protein
MNNLIIQLWWVVPVIILLLIYKFVLRVFFGMVIVPDDRIGLVVKKYVLSANKRLPDGRIIAIDGEAGMQAKALASGLYWRMWPWQYAIDMAPFTIISCRFCHFFFIAVFIFRLVKILPVLPLLPQPIRLHFLQPRWQKHSSASGNATRQMPVPGNG